MRALTLIAVALVSPFAAGLALADSEVRMGNDFVRITARPCKDDKVLAAIVMHGRDPLDFRAARASFAGVEYAACWTLMGRAAYLIYEDGDQGIVPERDLKAIPEA